MKNLRIYLITLLCTVISLPESTAAEWQWSVKIPGIVSNKGGETMRVKVRSV